MQAPIYHIIWIPSHLQHALRTYERVGGIFVALSQEAKEVCEQFGLPVEQYDINQLAGDTSAEVNAKNTTNALNKKENTVLFYDNHPALCHIVTKLPLARTFLLWHGNSIKQWHTLWDGKQLNDFTYITALGSYREKNLRDVGVEASKILPVGLARWDAMQKLQKQDKSLLRSKLGIPQDMKVVSYLPTWEGPTTVSNIGLKLARRLPDDVYFIFRPHPKTPPDVIRQYTEIIDQKKNASYLPEKTATDDELLQIYVDSDIFVGEISSVIIDSILMYKPIVFIMNAYLGKHQEFFEPIEELYNACTHIDINSMKNVGNIIHEVDENVDRDVWEKTINKMFYLDNYDELTNILMSPAEEK
ncbi:CDP-glycerol glycerophosphotransferase family protein [Patescibacteria group bacterium]